MAVVTISRQVGSWGDEIARGLSDALGYHLVTREEIHALGAQVMPSFARQLEHLEQEGALGFWERLFFRQPMYLSLFAAVILELASRRKVIILGRGAQVILREVPQALRVRVVAPRRIRAERLAVKKDFSLDEAQEFISQHDQARRALVNQIFTHDPGNWSLYHLVLNTEAVDVSGGVAILEQAVREVKRLHPGAEVSALLGQMALGKRVEAVVRQEVLNSTQLRAQGEADGLVRLTGSVPSAADSRRSEELAQGVPGVKRVENELRTTRVSMRWPV